MLRDPAIPVDATVIALRALAHVAGDDELGPRLLAITGLAPDELRARAADPVVLAAVLDFLCQHEPSLIEVAAALDVTPQQLSDAARRLDA